MQVSVWIGVLLLLGTAGAMGILAWRAARRARDREWARVELLKVLSFPEAAGVPGSDQSTPDLGTFASEQEIAPALDARGQTPTIFGEGGPPPTSLPRWISLAAVVVVAVLVGTLYAILAGGLEETTAVTTPAARRTDPSVATASVNARGTAARTRPVEVIDLQHRFGAATDFYVSGRVRNPADSQALPELMAVVDLLDADGRILSSRMAPLERPVLESGQTSAFSLAFPRVAGRVARYQVAFLLHGRDKIPQIDRRAPVAAPHAPSS